jgi:pimeloyl-ACP methyl ester carboxylesterase
MGYVCFGRIFLHKARVCGCLEVKRVNKLNIKIKTKSMKQKLTSIAPRGIFAAILLVTFYIALGSNQVSAQRVNNIVIVHGAFADASGFEGVYKILTKKGYNVSLVQNPCTSLEDDVAATNEVLNSLDGPAILVGHSWGGTVITQAGVAPKVAGLVYIEGFMLEVGETSAQLAGSEPAAKEAGALVPNANGWIFYPKEKYHMGFCADLPKEKSDFMYNSQVPITLKCFIAPVTVSAWKTKPSWAVVSTEDKSINPVILKKMYARAGAKVTEINASHVVYMSHPKEISEVIELAAAGTLGK